MVLRTANQPIHTGMQATIDMYNKRDCALQYNAQSKIQPKVIGCLHCIHPISRGSTLVVKPKFKIRQSFNDDVFMLFWEIKAMYKHS